MNVLIAGANGKIARRLARVLRESGHEVRGIIRSPEQADSMRELGAEPVILDLEQEVDWSVADGSDAIVFAAGAGPGSDPERKQTMDLGGAVKLVDSAEAQGVGRFVMVSAMGAADPESGPEKMQPYLRAKAAADERLAASSLDWTIVRPGSLTDEAPTGLVDVGVPSLGRRGEITRDDVAAVLAACLELDATVGKTFEVLGGETEIRKALGEL
ncbi:MAG: SDR family oxidoreductase [Thermoleophilaceae bacterium]|nr:SDR family oxidoreductase [Thermoleophilaceae bacterium]